MGAIQVAVTVAGIAAGAVGYVVFVAVLCREWKRGQ